MSTNVSHQQNPNIHLNKPPHKLIKNKPTKKSPRSNKNKTTNTILNNNNNKNTNNTTNPTKPLKVVHISNPMKYEASPTEFRALVQELTGRDADLNWLEDDYHYRVNHPGTVVGGGSSDGDDGVTDDQVVQVVQDDDIGNINNENNNNNNNNNSNNDVYYCDDVTSFSTNCFGPSDHIGYDYFVPFHHGDIIDEDFRALMADH